MSQLPPVSLESIQAAAQRIASHAVRTPLLESAALNAHVGGRVLLKAECLQRTGSFKFRGAFNRCLLIPQAERVRGVVAFSSGNHAQGVAHAAQLLGMQATIVMPADSPKLKITNTRGYGAEVVLYDRWTESREAIGARIAAEQGATLIKPFDDAGVISGQGTAGLEIADSVDRLDAVIVCASGGGLAAGVATAVTARFPACQVYTAEPAAHDDLARSLESGVRETNLPDAAPSLCDALMAPQPGEITFPILKQLQTQGLRVTEDEVKVAVAFAYFHLKMVVEPGGAAALAAVLAGKLDVRGQTVALTLSGGNMDPETLALCLRNAA
jgi:threonine dehydratase